MTLKHTNGFLGDKQERIVKGFVKSKQQNFRSGQASEWFHDPKKL